METAICRREGCGKEFQANKNEQQVFCSKYCREKDWREKNRAKLNQKVREYRRKRYVKEGAWYDNSPKSKANKAWMIEIKSRPCVDCGGTFDVCCMDFDHKEGTKKEYNIGTMFAHHYSRELIEIELAKCELVCSNCHRIRTKHRRTGSGISRKLHT